MPVEAVCPRTGKRQMTFEVAENAARRARRNRDSDSERVSAYHCQCGWWHTGHRDKIKRPKR